MISRRKTYLLSFATPAFYRSQSRLSVSARSHGIDEVFEYRQKDIKRTPFYCQNRRILNQRRGAGYWLWKPYFLIETLKRVPNDSIIVYSDAAIEIVGDLDPLFPICEQTGGIVLFSNAGHLNRTWTKRDCFVLMGHDTEDYWNGQNIQASFHLWKRTERNFAFLQQWLSYCRDARILTDIPNECGSDNLPGFIEHRWDQSVLSVLAISWGLEIYRDPSQWGNHDKLEEFREPGEFLQTAYSLQPYQNSCYGSLLNHHRQRDTTFRERVESRYRQLVKTRFYSYLRGLKSILRVHGRR
jgi:hypothetical protein